MERSPAVSKKLAKNVPFRSKRSTVEVPDDVKKKLEPPSQNP
jgi:hypothetical protein